MLAAIPGEFRYGYRQVGEYKERHYHERHPHAELLAHQIAEPFSGYHSHPCRHLLNYGQCDRYQDQCPKQAITFPGADNGIGGNPARVVPGVARNESRADDAQDGYESGLLQIFNTI